MAYNNIATVDIEMFVALIPEGSGNAIKRNDLTRTCVDMGLISEKCKDQDRTMRKMLQKARIDHCILSKPRGGYYRPTAEEYQNIIKHRNTEVKRAKSTFVSVRYDGKLYEDYQRGRM